MERHPLPPHALASKDNLLPFLSPLCRVQLLGRRRLSEALLTLLMETHIVVQHCMEMAVRLLLYFMPQRRRGRPSHEDTSNLGIQTSTVQKTQRLTRPSPRGSALCMKRMATRGGARGWDVDGRATRLGSSKPVACGGFNLSFSTLGDAACPAATPIGCGTYSTSQTHRLMMRGRRG